MRASRFPGRVLIFGSLLLRLPGLWPRSKPAPDHIQRILVLHQFLLGDAMMATSLLAKLRQQFPLARIVLACPPSQAPLYQSHPYGVQALPWHPKDFASLRRLFSEPRFDMVYLMGENRLSFLARAIGARWIVGFAGESPAYKNIFVDEGVPYSSEPEAWAETAATLVSGAEPTPFALSDWPLGQVELPTLPARYVVLHVGASSANKFWPTENWQIVAAEIRRLGLTVMWSCGPGEQTLVEAISPLPEDSVMAGCLNLVQLRAVLAQATACISPDTGVAHLAKTACTPLIMLFGPGSETIFGASHFFANSACLTAGLPLFPQSA
jgi:ADP-heptose:LPS heptosyltransferase